MKHKFLSAIAGLVLVIAGSAGNAAEYLVKYKNQAAFNQIHQMASIQSNGMKVLSTHAPGSYVLVDLNSSQKLSTLMNLKNNPNIEWVTPNIELKKYSATFDAQALKDQWANNKVQANKAWERAGNKGNKNIVIAVIDTGVDYRHKNLAPNMIPGFDFRDNDSDPMDETSGQNPGHGTHVAGSVGATGLVDGGISGLAPNISIMPIRFLGKDGSGSLDGGVKSIDYAIEKGVDVISASWGAGVSKANAKAVIEAVERADKAGIIFVAAAANDGKNNDTNDYFPTNANTPNMISVAASNSNDSKPNWSNYGRANVHVAAPGENIVSTLPNDRYGNLSGTSMATPLVAGLVGFLKSQDPSLTGAQIRALLQTTGAKTSIEVACNCRVDAFNAVDHLLNKNMWMVPSAATIAKGGSINLSVMNATGSVTYASSNPAVLTVGNDGILTAVADGSAKVTATDSSGKTVSSLDFHVGASSGGGQPGEPGQPPGGGGECPLGDAGLCEIACQFMPDLPWCSQ